LPIPVGNARTPKLGGGRRKDKTYDVLVLIEGREKNPVSTLQKATTLSFAEGGKKGNWTPDVPKADLFGLGCEGTGGRQTKWTQRLTQTGREARGKTTQRQRVKSKKVM